MELIKLVIVIVPLCLHAPAVVKSGLTRYQIKYLAALHLCRTPTSNNDVGQRSSGLQSPPAYVWFASDSARRRHRSKRCSRHQGTLNIPVRGRAECHRADLFINEMVRLGTTLTDIL